MRLAWLIVLLAACTSRPPYLPSRPADQLDPQGQDKNLGAEKCLPPRVAYYVYPDGVTPFYVECLSEHLNE